MKEEPLTENGEEADFRKLLKKTKADPTPIQINVLLQTPVLIKRLRIICGSLTFNEADADELYCDVSVRVLTGLSKFEPDYTKPYGNFFAWTRKIAQNRHVDNLRHPQLPLSDDRPEDLFDISDKQERIDIAVERKMAIDRFWKFIGNTSPRTQRIMQLWREGFTLREIETELAKDGIEYSHVAIGELQKRVIAKFIEIENGPQKSKVTRKGEQPSKASTGGTPLRKTGSESE